MQHNLTEILQAWFYLWRITGKQIYRDWSWSIFEAFERHTRAEAGHSAIQVCGKWCTFKWL